MLNQTKQSLDLLKILNILVIFTSVVICSMLMLVHIPGMELLGNSPNWLLIWVVAWSMKRTVWQGAIAGMIMGLIYDGITTSPPSHIVSLVVVGVLTSSLQKQKYIGEDFISVAFIVFFMVVVAETVFAFQYGRQQILSMPEVWQQYQQIVIASATISSLWSPAFYYPFNRWIEK
jgi:rod shape-determining protein MreD